MGIDRGGGGGGGRRGVEWLDRGALDTLEKGFHD